MVAASNGAGIRELPVAEANAQTSAHARARDPITVTLREVPARRRQIADLLAGGSIWHTQPPSLVDARTRHHHAVGVFNGWLPAGRNLCVTHR
jgi:hypothetical protein